MIIDNFNLLGIGQLNLYGIMLGAVAFLIIGLFHPLVIKGEYLLGIKMAWLFFIMGLITTVLSIIIPNIFVSVALGVFGFSSFWGIKEVKEQIERVEQGKFPKNPKRKYKDDKK